MSRNRHPSDDAFDAFYKSPTPANAVRLAIADHVSANKGGSSSEYVTALRAAVFQLETYAALNAEFAKPGRHHSHRATGRLL